MPAQSRTGVIRGETKRFGRCGVDHFVDVDIHLVGNDLHFVDQSDIDGAMNVFQQLGQFRSACGTDRHYRIDRRTVERDTGFQAGRRDAAAHLGNGAGFKCGIAGILALRREHEKYILAYLEPARLDARLEFFVGRAGIRGTFQ